ncbi:hypothetical protein ABZV67_36130 [Streptomyces sp. NPDC005065]|uniref:hypothetical protein n=1 Tax=unclassified Streptomyces TaxID=2593676 RepID=UPI00339EA883
MRPPHYAVREEGACSEFARPGPQHAQWTGTFGAKKSAAEVENEKLRQQVERLQKDLARNKAAPEVMGKASALLEMISESAD